MKPRPPLPSGPHMVLGLARSGTAAALALAARGQRVIGVDAGRPDAAELAEAGVEVHLGVDGVALLERVRSVIKSPGVPGDAPAVAAARARGQAVIGELELAWRLLPNEMVAVTGTNGKTTTVQLLGHLHREAGVAVAVAGNVGTALSSLVERVSPATTVVCEASSFQLEDTVAFAPEAAVLLNLSPDHLDRHGTMAAYRAAKLELFARQDADDVAVVPLELVHERLGGDARRVSFGCGADAELSVRDGELVWREQPLLGVRELGLRGAHNVQNAMAAAAVCLERGLDIDAVRAGLRSFAGVAHRLEQVASHDGVAYVNDSKATNVASTLVALAAFPPASVHLILGGRGKGQDFTQLRDAVAGACRGVYLIGEDAATIERALGTQTVSLRRCGVLEEAVAEARVAARAGDTVLLSPACESYDQFVDFEDRGDRFRELAQSAT